MILNRTKHTIQIFDAYAQEYQDKFMNLNLYDNSLDMFCESINANKATVLDAACGPGNISKYLLSKRTDFQLLGIDLSEKMIALAKANNPNAIFKIFDCRAVLQLNQKFDGIVCGFGLPYLTKKEAIQFIGDCSKTLNPNGILYLSTMEGLYEKSGYETSSSGDSDTAMYIHYHEADYLVSALETSQFEILEIKRSVFQYDNGKTNNDLIIISQLKQMI